MAASVMKKKKKNRGRRRKREGLTTKECSRIEQRIGLVRLEFLGGGGGARSRRGRRFSSATTTASARCGVLLLHASPLKHTITMISLHNVFFLTRTPRIRRRRCRGHRVPPRRVCTHAHTVPSVVVLACLILYPFVSVEISRQATREFLMVVGDW